jgi:hypothetical protein
MGIAELCAMTLVKDKDDSLVLHLFHFRKVMFFRYGVVQFLYGRDNEFSAIVKLFYQLVVSSVASTLPLRKKLNSSMVFYQDFTINNEYYFLYLWQLH